MELKDINTFHQSENVDTKTLVHQMMPKFYEYIMATELAANPNTTHILVGTNKESLYLHNNPDSMRFLFDETILLDTIGAKFVIYQNTIAGTKITDHFDRMNCF